MSTSFVREICPKKGTFFFAINVGEKTINIGFQDIREINNVFKDLTDIKLEIS